MNLGDIAKKILSDPILLRLSDLAKKGNVPLFLVGGYIRDSILGAARKDYDFALAREDAWFISVMEEALRFHFFKVGREEDHTITYRIVKEEFSFDLTFLQGRNIEEDLQRRDFTVNTLALSLLDKNFNWAERAMEDIKNRVIRPVSHHSIDDDPLRMLRAIRYLCTLSGFVLENGLSEEITSKKDLIARVPGERIKIELDHILLSSQPVLGIKSLYETGLFLTLWPEVKGLGKIRQGGYHHLDVLSHSIQIVEKVSWALDWVASNGRKLALGQNDLLVLYYAALFHDIGKQDTYTEDAKGKVHFYHHETFSCRRAEGIMERLRFSNPMKNRTLRLIQNHMRILNLAKETKETALKRLVNQIGEETPLLVLHTLSDKEASRGILSIQIDEVVESHCLRILDLCKEKEVVHPVPLITGQDVLALGYLPGPKVGQILGFIRQKQVEGEIRTREEALEMLREKFVFQA